MNPVKNFFSRSQKKQPKGDLKSQNMNPEAVDKDGGGGGEPLDILATLNKLDPLYANEITEQDFTMKTRQPYTNREGELCFWWMW